MDSVINIDDRWKKFLPKGEIGPQGPQGPQGIKGFNGSNGGSGPQGAKGDNGEPGAQGIQGPIGLTGPQGPIGLTGPQGPIGLTGPQGPIGLTGLQGEKGDKGDKGDQGIQGIQGIPGAQGIQGEPGLPGFDRTINAQIGTTYTIAISDELRLITCDNASPITITIDTNANIAMPVGARVDILQKGAGKVTFSGSVGVTINSKGGNKSIGGQYVAVSIIQYATDYWFLIGDIIA